MLLGILESFSIWVLPAAFKDVISIAILLVILFVKPSGLFGSAEEARLKEEALRLAEDQRRREDAARRAFAGKVLTKGQDLANDGKFVEAIQVFNKFVDVWQDEAGVETYAEAVAERMAFRANEGQQLAMSREQWLEFAGTAGFYAAREKARSMGFEPYSALEYEFFVFDETPDSVREKGYRISGHALIPLGNAEGEQEDAEANPPPHAGWQAARQLTALARSGFSAPVQTLARYGFLDGRLTLFDYGCGRGDDVRGLAANGLTAAGWDPYYAPDQPVHAADLVNLGFVINVIEDRDERLDALIG